MTKLKMMAAVAGLALATAAAPASATDFVLDLTSKTNSADNGATNARTYNFDLDGQKINVRATAWSAINGKITNAYLGSYTYGLGVTNDNENGTNGTHTVDTQDGQDFILFQFSTAVDLSKIKTTSFSVNGYTTGSDASVRWGNTATAWNQDLGLDGKSTSALTSVLNNQQVLAGGSGTLTRSVDGTASNLWLVAATNVDGTKVDGFKLSAVTVSSAVPEPATWMMMIGGFAMVGAAVRRRKSVTGGAAVA
ncbi:PEPxxWA-CTERM sorting domain-containing protein [Sphingomonas citri]|uniref:PEPxxWA-CTERM sorting domain-containing protein n=1 Tax=Sphingomonas citri TaxID=2862499 RepID=A0ABS7BQ12_9SPHN|nr:PEPxxWA-CTERM sorting domain-containing protein [Sphingomonas citri]MBW6531666.1 PEPxxWA-CTERM sorting domain-containing protein [Sphingomonas citri]